MRNTLGLLLSLWLFSACATSTPIQRPSVEHWPIEDLEPLEKIVLLPPSDSKVIGGLTDEMIKAIQRNHQRLYVWGMKNQMTIEKFNSKLKEGIHQ